MKRLFAILFCFVYLVPSLGISLNLHYCGETLTAVSLFNTNKAKCCCGEEDESDDCCKDKAFSYQIKEDQNTAVKGSPLQVKIDRVLDSGIDVFQKADTFSLISNSVRFIEQKSVPDDPVYIMNRVLRI